MRRLGPNEVCGCGSGKKVKKCCLVSIEYMPEEQNVIDLKRAEKEKWDIEDNQAAKENLIAFDAQLEQWKVGHTKENFPLTGKPFDRKTVGVKAMIRRYDDDDDAGVSRSHANIGMAGLAISLAAVGMPWKNPFK